MGKPTRKIGQLTTISPRISTSSSKGVLDRQNANVGHGVKQSEQCVVDTLFKGCRTLQCASDTANWFIDVTETLLTGGPESISLAFIVIASVYRSSDPYKLKATQTQRTVISRNKRSSLPRYKLNIPSCPGPTIHSNNA